MKNKYKLLVSIIGIEFIIVSILSKRGIQIESLLLGTPGLVIFFCPILFLLYEISKDRSISTKSRVFSKFIFIFIIICCLAGIMAKGLGINN